MTLLQTNELHLIQLKVRVIKKIQNKTKIRCYTLRDKHKKLMDGLNFQMNVWER